MRLLLLLVAAASAKPAPLVDPRAFSPVVCDAVLEELAHTHRETLIGREIDPFGRALHRLRDRADVPLVTRGHPRSLEALRTELNATLAGLEDHVDPVAELEAFRIRWGFTESQLIDLLLPYRLTAGPHRDVLRRLFPSDADAQELGAWAKYRAFLDAAPRLAERYRFYLGHAGASSVPEMVAELRRRGDAALTEPRVRAEINALHLQLADVLESPLEDATRQAVDAALGTRSASSVPVTATTREQAARHALDAGVPLATLAPIFSMTVQELRFALHAARVRPRGVEWNRSVTDESGTRWTEEDYLRHLVGSQLTRAAIAERLNAAAARFRGSPIGPEHDEFRTVASVQTKLGELRLTAPTSWGPDRRLVPGFGLVKADGKLRLPEALALIRARRAGNRTYDEIGSELGVGANAVREFERKHSELYRDGLPTVLARFLRPDEDGAVAAPRSPKPPPAPGVDSAFDAFYDAFRDGTDGWVVTGARFGEELGRLRVHLGVDATAWAEHTANVPGRIGNQSRADDRRPGASKELKATARRGRWALYQLWRTLIPLYNTRYPDRPRLSEAQLGTADGIRAVLEALRGAKLGHEYAPGHDRRFDAFFRSFRAGSEGWVVTSPERLQRELARMRAHLGVSDEDWKALVGDLPPSTGKIVREDDARRAQDATRENGLRKARHTLYQLLRKLIVRHNARFPETPLDEAQLESVDGVRAVLEALRGSKLGPDYSAGKDPRFDRFSAVFIDGTKGWEITRRALLTAELERMRGHLAIPESEWSELTATLPPTGGGVARSRTAEESAVRNARHDFYRFLRALIPRHNARFPDRPALTEEQLESAAGLRAIVAALRGS